MLINSVIASLMCGKNLINMWLTQRFDSGVHVYELVCLLGWTLWTHSVTEINLVIYCEWLVPCLLLNYKNQNFLEKVTLSNSCFVAVFRVLHFTRYETTILRCGIGCHLVICKFFCVVISQLSPIKFVTFDELSLYTKLLLNWIMLRGGPAALN